ncbi:MAG TPA: histidine phosphatase family protein [Kofleriaceae bacterium]|nr:histidine phosphatase family protein [Kofleriaceae bacterium]
MGSLLLIRHGQAAYGEADHDRLTPRGVQQAQALGHFLATARIDRVYVGPHRRHQQTFDHAHATKPLPEPTLLPGLAEYPAVELLTHFMPKLIAEDPRFAELPRTPTRELAGRALHTILGRWARDEWQVDGVERVEKFAERVRGALDQIIAEAKSGARIAVFTSAGPIGVSAGLTFGATPHHMVRSSIVIRNTSVSEIRFRSDDFAWHPERIALVSFNSTHHLPPELHTEY